MFKRLPTRFELPKAFIDLFLILSFAVGFSFLFWNFSELDKGCFALENTFIIGSLFALATISLFTIPHLLYLFIIAKKMNNELSKAGIYSFFSTFKNKVLEDFYENNGLTLLNKHD